jgi:putative ATP-dependent endonuclease of OLD family
VPQDESLRVTPDRIPINDLRQLLRDKGVAVPGGTAKAPFVDAVRQLIAASPKTLAEKVFNTVPHSALFKIVDFRQARDAEQVLNATMRTLFAQLIRSGKYPELGKVESKVKKVLQSKADELKSFIGKHRPDVRDVVVEPSVDFSQAYRSVDIGITDTRGQPVPLDLRGEGLRAHLRLAAFEWSGQILSARGEATTIFFLDEPDTHLDYHAQRRILGVIEEYTANGQALVATHSMNLINRVPLEKIVHFELDRSSGKSSPRIIEAPAGDEVDAINRVGNSLGIENAVLFYERCFVIFEGETEAQSIPTMYEVWSGSKWYLDGVRFLNGYNNEGAILFARFLHVNGRDVVALIDEDTTLQKGFPRQFTRGDLESQARLPNNRINTIGPTCFELAFPTSAWSRAIFRATNGKRRLNRTKLDNLRGQPREFIKLLKKSSGNLSKVQLGNALASVITRREIPNSIASAFEAARELAKR